jgi:hypothetical protein
MNEPIPGAGVFANCRMFCSPKAKKKYLGHRLQIGASFGKKSNTLIFPLICFVYSLPET